VNNLADRHRDWGKYIIIICFAVVTIVILDINLDNMAPACNSRSAVAPDFLPKVPKDRCKNEEEESVGVLTASWDQLSSTFDVVWQGGL